MKKEQIMDAMDYIDPALVAAVDATAPRRGGRRWVRCGLIAACLCLALAGTAVATHFLGVEIHEKDENGVIWMSNGIAYYPYDILSDEIKAWAGRDEYHIIHPVDSWQAAESLIGFDLMNNPVLDAAAATRASATIDGVHGQFFVQAGPNLGQIKTSGYYEMNCCSVKVSSYFYTTRMTGDWDEKFMGILSPEGEQIERNVYTTPSGLEAQLMEVSRPDTFSTCLATISLNGVPFVVEVDTDPFAYYENNIESARAVLLQVLDGFVLS